MLLLRLFVFGPMVKSFNLGKKSSQLLSKPSDYFKASNSTMHAISRTVSY